SRVLGPPMHILRMDPRSAPGNRVNCGYESRTGTAAGRPAQTRRRIPGIGTRRPKELSALAPSIMQRHGSNTPLRALRTLDCPLWLPAWAARGIAWTFLLLVVAASAVVTKEARMAGGLSALAELDPAPGAEPEARDAVVLPAARMIETEAAA